MAPKLSPLIRLVPLVLGCLALSACGGSGQGAAPAAKVVATHGSGGGDDMVEAVSSARDASTVELKFALGRRPVTGSPLDVHLRWIPHADLGRVGARLHVDDGLEVRSGGNLPELEHPVRDVPVDQTVVIVPAHDGIFSIQVTVTADSDSGAVSRTFSIPVIVAPAGGTGS